MARLKFVQRWIDSSPLRARWWVRVCPECENPELMFTLVDTGPKVKRVSCHKCGWAVAS